jgi:hypothetical protein
MSVAILVHRHFTLLGLFYASTYLIVVNKQVPTVCDRGNTSTAGWLYRLPSVQTLGNPRACVHAFLVECPHGALTGLANDTKAWDRLETGYISHALTVL